MNHGKIDRRDFIKRAMIAGASMIVAGGLLHRRRSLAGVFGENQAAIDRAMRDHKLGHIDDATAQAVVAGYITSSLGKPGSPCPRSQCHQLGLWRQLLW